MWRLPFFWKTAGVLSYPKSIDAWNWPVAENLNMWPRMVSYRVHAPYSTLPSGSTVGEDELMSRTRPAGCWLVCGSTPKVASLRQAPCWGAGVLAIGTSTPQPSFRWSRIEAAHFGLRSGLAATTKLYRSLK